MYNQEEEEMKEEEEEEKEKEEEIKQVEEMCVAWEGKDMLMDPKHNG